MLGSALLVDLVSSLCDPYLSLFVLLTFWYFVAERRRWERRGPLGAERGQEHGLRPAGGALHLAPNRLVTAQHQQSDGDVLRLLPAQSQPFHPFPRVLPVCRDGGPHGQRREKVPQGSGRVYLCVDVFLQGQKILTNLPTTHVNR